MMRFLANALANMVLPAPFGAVSISLADGENMKVKALPGPPAATTKTEADLIEYLRLASPRFTVTTYDVFSHNCNNFSDEVARFLTGQAVPERILNMANEYNCGGASTTGLAIHSGSVC